MLFYSKDFVAMIKLRILREEIILGYLSGPEMQSEMSLLDFPSWLIHEDVGYIPVFAQWIKDLAFP